LGSVLEVVMYSAYLFISVTCKPLCHMKFKSNPLVFWDTGICTKDFYSVRYTYVSFTWKFCDQVHILWTTRGEFLSSCGVSTTRVCEVCKIANNVWNICGVCTRGLLEQRLQIEFAHVALKPLVVAFCVIKNMFITNRLHILKTGENIPTYFSCCL
jgi:hypothetical protein